jgi:hypothetical protein
MRERLGGCKSMENRGTACDCSTVKKLRTDHTRKQAISTNRTQTQALETRNGREPIRGRQNKAVQEINSNVRIAARRGGASTFGTRVPRRPPAAVAHPRYVLLLTTWCASVKTRIPRRAIEVWRWWLAWLQRPRVGRDARTAQRKASRLPRDSVAGVSLRGPQQPHEVFAWQLLNCLSLPSCLRVAPRAESPKVHLYCALRLLGSLLPSPSASVLPTAFLRILHTYTPPRSTHAKRSRSGDQRQRGQGRSAAVGGQGQRALAAAAHVWLYGASRFCAWVEV